MPIEQLVSEVLARVGLTGVSVGVLALLVSVIVWSSRARHAGHVAGRTVGTARWVAVVLALLAVVGVVSFHPDRAANLAAYLADVLPRFWRFLEGVA